MEIEKSKYAPVIIGGVGGSGTRVVAEIVKLFDYYLGNDLNSAFDNLTYTLLFKRPAWFREHFPDSKAFHTGLSIMEKAMLTGKSLSIREKLFLKRAVKDMATNGHNREGQGKGEWAYQRLDLIKKATGLDMEKYRGWGWKEPNGHLALPVFAKYFEDIRYIHTVRHGLDMAFSSNQQQLFNWASLFDIDIPQNPGEIPLASFRFWVEANRRAIETGKRLGDRKFLLVNFDHLCDDPSNGVRKIADFLGTDPGEKQLEKASGMPVRPDTVGRYMDHPGIMYDPADIAFLKELGFSY